jgi:uncharacterized protein involved in type VI secretion and phage assembly
MVRRSKVVVERCRPKAKSKGKWKLAGYDTFSSEWYDLDGRYGTKKKAQEAARKRLRSLERSQPTSTSGGQSGIQDQVFIVDPDGGRTRC